MSSLEYLSDSFPARCIREVYRLLIKQPFQDLYFRAYWRGQDMVDMCARLTGHSSSFWALHLAACQEIMLREMDVIYAYMAYVFYFFILWYSLQMLAKAVWNYRVKKPLVRRSSRLAEREVL